MQLAKFIDYHRPTLEANEAKYNLILGILGSPSAPGLQLWTLDGPGACAIRSPGYPGILGALTEAQCHRLADDTRTLDYPGVVGSDATARWFVERGGNFHAPIPLHIQVLDRAPTYPAASGYARQVSAEDIAVFSEWMLAFRDEAGARMTRDLPANSSRSWPAMVAIHSGSLTADRCRWPEFPGGRATQPRSPAYILHRHCAAAVMPDQPQPRSRTASSPREKPQPAFTPTSAIRSPIGVTPGSASHPSVPAEHYERSSAA